MESFLIRMKSQRRTDMDDKILRINEGYRDHFPMSCPLIGKDETGKETGICAQYMLDRRTCPIHGDTKEYKQPS